MRVTARKEFDMSIDNEEPRGAVQGREQSTREQPSSGQQRDPRLPSQQSRLVGTPFDLDDHQNDLSFASTEQDIPDGQLPLSFYLPQTLLPEVGNVSDLEVTNLSQSDAEPSQMDQRALQVLVEERHSLEPFTLESDNQQTALREDWSQPRQPPSPRATPEIYLSQATNEAGFDESPPRQSGQDRSSRAPSPENISSVAFDDGSSIGGSVRTPAEERRSPHADPTSEGDRKSESNAFLRRQSPVDMVFDRNVDTYGQRDTSPALNHDATAITNHNVDNYGPRRFDVDQSNSNQLKRSHSSSEPPPPAKRLRGDDSVPRELHERTRSSHSR